MRVRRVAAVALALVALPACGDSTSRFGAPDPVSAQGRDWLQLWRGAVIAALAVAALVWLLVLWAVVRYRRRSDEVPSQRHEHIPLEVAYTVVPILIVAVLFAFTVVTQRKVTRLSPRPDLTVVVTAFQWQWQFRYADEGVTIGAADGSPTLVLPVGRTVRFELETADVIHSFWVPDFLNKRDMIPGVENEIDVEVERAGTYAGRCAEFCGLDHYRMNFTVEAVPAADFDRWLADQRDAGIVTILADRPAGAAEPPEHAPRATGLLAFLTSTDHKRIGVAYMVTAFAFFLVGGALAELIRAELQAPGLQVVDAGRYNELFTMHGSVMLFLFIGPFAFGLANYIVPLHIGAPDMAFPRLNALSYWFFLFGGITMLAGFLTADGAADCGWTGYLPLCGAVRAPSLGNDLWLMALVLTGLSGVLTAVNILATVFTMRARGMSMFRMPVFTWNMVVTSVLVLIAFPLLTSAAAMLFADRHLGAHIFDESAGGVPLLWQHLFWFFGHPEVYIVVLPYFGVITEVIPVFSRRPVFGYTGMVLATLAIAALSVGVWAHHMFATGAVLLPFFSGLSFLIAVPTGVKIFNWVGTMWGGQISFPTPMLFAIAFLLTFVLGGVTGVLLASPPIDFHLHDSYFVVAHMHYVLFGGSTFALFVGVYYWFPKFTGRMLSEGLGRVHLAMTFVGFHLTFLVQHVLGLEGMPRRVADYLPSDGFTGLNRLSSLGAYLLGASILPFLWNVWRSLRRGALAGDDPWGGHTLEWATSSPPPPENFDRPLPPIRSNRPVWDLHHGQPARERSER